MHPRPGVAVLAWSLLICGGSGESTHVYAGVERLCAVSYLTQAGWAEEFVRDIQFVTGTELQANGYPVSRTAADYVVVWFAQNQAAVVQLDALRPDRGPRFESADFRSLFRSRHRIEGEQMNDDRPRLWSFRCRIAPGPLGGGFLDPRAESSR